MPDSIILIGGGGHCKACIDVIETTQHTIGGILDKDPAQKNLLNYPVIGTDEEIEKLIAKGHHFLITIGQVKSAAPRTRLYDKITGFKGKLATIVAASALLSKHASAGKGTIIMHQSIVNAGSTIGNNCIINNKSLVEHDCNIGDHVHISTAAIINGDCRIGKKVFIGSNSVLVQGVRIADEVIIGAGSVVVNDISEKGIYAGNPARKIG